MSGKLSAPVLILDGFPQRLPALRTIRVTIPGKILRFCHEYWCDPTLESASPPAESRFPVQISDGFVRNH